MMDKAALRVWISQQKKACPIEERRRQSARIFERIFDSSWYKESQTILCYWSMLDEVYTHDFIQRSSSEKLIYLPVIDGDTLMIRRYEGLDRMVAGPNFGILEPISECECISIDKIDLVIVPGVAFDRLGGRMGRGRGFYDRLLSATGPITLGVGFDFQEVSELPLEAHDVRLQAVFFGD